VHEAASYGVPVVATQLLCAQLGWEDQQDLLAAPASDAQAFAKAVVTLYRSEGLWTLIRDNAAERIRTTCGQDVYEQALAASLDRVFR
jgi:glycosyltransferase involved in cell wall biosynthesis